MEFLYSSLNNTFPGSNNKITVEDIVLIKKIFGDSK
jgi:hypothetical protein